MGILRGKHVFASLLADMTSVESADTKAKYAAFLLAVCNAYARHEDIKMSDAQSDLAFAEKPTTRYYLDKAVEAGHVTVDQDPNDKRAKIRKPSQKVLEAYRHDMSAFARIVSKLQDLSPQEISEMLLKQD